MGNYTEIRIFKDKKYLTTVSGGRSLMASVSCHDDLVKGFANESGNYFTEASDDYGDEENEFQIEVKNSTIEINGVEKTIPISFSWCYGFDEMVLEGLRLHPDLKLPLNFKIEGLTDEAEYFGYIVVGDKVKKISDFDGGIVIESGEYGSIVESKTHNRYSTIKEIFEVGSILDKEGKIVSTAKEEERKKLENVLNRCKCNAEYAQQQLENAQKTLSDFLCK